MRVNVILRYVGMIMLLLAFFMFVSAGISYVNHMDSAFYPLLLSALLTALLGGFPLIFVEKQDRITNKEGFCIVVGSWLLACVVGMFPYLIWGGEFSVINAWFETVSGFTTTGSSILQNVEALPRGLQFWRMSSTWVGGMGVVMFALVILPALGTSKMMLSSVEMSTLARDNYLGTQYLYELGHRDILYFGQRPGSTTHQLRADGYMKACHEFNLTPHFFNSEYSRSSIQGGYQLAKELFRKPLDCTAVFAATDSNALGMLTAADEMGIDIPGHLSLIGFDNISATALSRIDLTTVDQPKRDMAVQAVDMLRDKIENGTQGYVHQILLPTLIQRGTCRKLDPSK